MKLKALALLLAVAGLNAAEPLIQPAEYTLELSADLKNKEYLFPIGILGDHGFRTIPFMGLNLTERSYVDYPFREGKPITYQPSNNDRGVYFFNIWAAHSIYLSRETKNHGTLKNSMGSNGKPHKGHLINLFDPNTRQYVKDAAKRTAAEVVRTDSPSIAVWGIDNEWELPVDYSPEAMAAFHVWLKKEYNGDLAKLNKAWQAEYKSFDDAVPPPVEECRTRPGAWLDFRRFQELAYADFIAEYFKAIQEVDPEKRPVISKSTQCTIEMQSVVRKRNLNHEFLANATRDISQGLYGIDQYGHNDRSIYELNYLYNCILPNDPAEKKYRYGIFYGETNNHSGPGWQFAQTYWRTLSNGAKGIEFFVMGSHGSAMDYATFGMTYADGVRRDRFYYLSRLASMIHRSEKFWHEAAPAENMPRVAMLMPQRDVLLSADTGVSWWDYSNNNRLSVFTHLRNMGYWVDVIPYGKLDYKSLSRYQALVLVDAEHLSQSECDSIKKFVREGGALLADMRAGNFDEHHIETAGLADVLGVRYKGVYTGIEVSPDDLWYNSEYGNVIRGDGKIVAELTTAKLVNEADVFHSAKSAWITLNNYGKGKALWFNTRLGALRPESVETKVVSKWFAQNLELAGVKAAYRSSNDNSEMMRVELPVVDSKGNCAITVAGITREALPKGELTVTVPKGDYKHAFWSAAEGTSLEKLNFKVRDNQLIFSMPEVQTAGVIYLFPAGVPMLGIKIEDLKETAKTDPYTFKGKPGQSFSVTVQLANPSNGRMKGGSMKLQALQGWTVSEPVRQAKDLVPGTLETFEFKVTIPQDNGQFAPEFIYPLLATLEQDGKRTAVNNAIITMEVDRTKYEHLLTDNALHSSLYRLYGIRTKATYGINVPDGSFKDPSGRGLVNGFDTSARIVHLEGKSADIVFDLKGEYDVTKVRLRNANRSIPVSMEVFVSKNGKEFTPVGKADNLEWKKRWCEQATKAMKGQFVKVRVGYKDAKGGYLDDVEIYGKPLK